MHALGLLTIWQGLLKRLLQYFEHSLTGTDSVAPAAALEPPLLDPALK